MTICENECYGCTACKMICPVNAIEMQENEKGFLIPVINSEVCVNCGLCQQVCQKEIEYNENKQSYIAKHLDEEKLLASQSGGAFTAISDVILNSNGTVYGATIDDDFEAKHIRTATKIECDKLHGSKYVQSRLENVLSEIEQDLKERKVLFSGTPCQVGGLLRYLKQKKCDLTNLYTVDLICHGTPSVLIWRDLLNYYRKKEHDEIKSVVFRERGGGSLMGRPSFFINIKKKQISDSIHRQLFYNNLALRDSCYKCKYARKDRVADFTIGDAWGVKEHNPEFYDNRGVSLIMFNTNKSLELLSLIKNSMEMKKIDLKDYMQGNLINPTKPNRNPQEFWKDYKKKSFNYIIHKYAKNNLILNYRYILLKIYQKLMRKKW